MKKVIALAVLCCLTLCSCKQNKLSSTQVMMDTVVTLTLYGSDNDTLSAAMAECRRYESLFSRTVPESETERINNSSGEPVTVSAETAELITLADEIYLDSGGAFDVTVLPLSLLWDVKNSTVPPESEKILAAKYAVCGEKLKLTGNTVTLPVGMSVDFGGIAKGFIADKITSFLKSKGIKNAIINLGGNVVVMGKLNGNSYKVGIQKPFESHGEVCMNIELSDKTAVTSGIYERYFEYNGKVYHHIIDTSTGYPADNGIASVTVIADSSAVADGLSTACLVLGTEKGLELAEHYDAELVFITTDGEIILSDGLESDGAAIPTLTLKN